VKTHGPPFLLREIKLEVTYRCPLACVHCSSDAEPTSTLEMSKNDATRIVAEALNMGVTEIAFSGGEPLVWESLPDLVEQCSNKGIPACIYTSGNVPDMEDIASSLKARGAGKMVFSIFAGNSAGHEAITRRAGSFVRTLASAQIARRIGLAVELHFVPMSINFQELPKVTALAKDIGVEKVSVLRFVPQGRGAGMPSLALSRAQNVHLRRLILEARNALAVRTGSPYNFLCLSDQPSCCAAIDRLIVAPDLSIYPCDAFKHIRPEELVGHDPLSGIAGSLAECWNGSIFLREVREYLTTDFAPPCSGCEELVSCLSGCLAQKVIVSGNLEKRPDPMCLRGGAVT
jgi:radical SAM protein with 4Fe4S-binding SPASM domain